MLPPVIKLLGMAGRIGLQIAYEIDDPEIDKQFVKGAIDMADWSWNRIDPNHEELPDFKSIYGDIDED